MMRSVPVSRIGCADMSTRGLTFAEAEASRQHYGVNRIVKEPASGWRSLLADTLRDPMVWFLICTALLFAGLGDYPEAAVLTVALLPIIGMDAYLHRRTQASTAGLSDRLASRANVVRDGAVQEIAALELVPGDLVIIAESEAFPGDGLIVSGDGLQVDESALTGESMPVRKKQFAGTLPADTDTAVDAACWGAAGTRLLTGQARLRLLFTGEDTLYGQIVGSAQEGSHAPTPLQQAVNSLVMILLVGAVLLCLSLAAIRYYQGYGVIDALLSALILAIAALPEEFPVVFTLFLGVGVYRLAQRQALVRRAVAVENIGRITCICTDKTGTLTEGRLQLAHIVAADGVEQDFVVQVAAMASRPKSGDPLDKLLLESALPMDGTVIAVFPFTEDRRREVALVRQSPERVVAVVKGAPETVFQMTRLHGARLEEWQLKTRELAGSGHKVIACASRQMENWQQGEPDQDYVLTGLLAFEDPVRDGVKSAVAQARQAGIRVIMITGDHPATGQAIARELGIGGDTPRVVEGPGLATRLKSQVAGDGLDFDVVARASPAQKLELVRALQKAGEIVAVTGDGVNDAPALQGADVGIAMGEQGTRTAREVASIVLLDDNFRTIVRAIAEGRQLFMNLKLSFAYLLMIHLPLVATATLIPVLGFPLLYLPIHIVWLELIIHPTAMLVFQELPASAGLEAGYRQPTVRFFDWQEWSVIGLVGLTVTLFVSLSYWYSLGAELDVLHARSMALVVLIIASAMMTAGLSGLRTRSAVIITLLTLGSAFVLVQYQPLSGLLHLSPLHLVDWAIAVSGGVVSGACAALIPVLQRRRRTAGAGPARLTGPVPADPPGLR
ncbi:MAG: cation-transporting P-type ATPase [Rhodospirillales bacterium]|nr:cation-transporting P-type ATPase [Rhodospirillales bacterium]